VVRIIGNGAEVPRKLHSLINFAENDIKQSGLL